MEGETTPWRAPKPHPMAFASTGALPKKHRATSERMSMPALATPETPSKRERSKFVVPVSISPFALSPHQLAASGRIPPIQSKSATKLSASFNAAYDPNSSDAFNAQQGPPTRSSSPIHHSKDSRLSDVFGHPDDEESYEDNPFSMDLHDSASEDEMDIYESYDISKAHHLPWKSPCAIFFTSEFFKSSDWRNSTGLLANSAAQSILESKATSNYEYFDTNFEILEIIGRGSFSDVFRVRRKTDGTILALKRSRAPFSGIVDRLRRVQEVENMWLASGHPHCIQILESWEQLGYLYILMELCDRGRDVIDYMAGTDKRFTEYQVWQILLQIASGLEYLHFVNIVHLDVKPANILINHQGVLKIGDFGLSMRLGAIHDSDMEGDKYYMAPETLEGQYDRPADVFSLGLLILELATDVELPAQGVSWQNLRHGDFSELSFDDVSDALNQLIKDMTDPEPIKRPTVQEVLRRAEAYSQLLINDSS